jgi:N-terminal domain of NWD NACHT-NTPase
MSSKSLATRQNRENLESGAQSPKGVRSKLKKLFSSSIKEGPVGESYVGLSLNQHNPSQSGRGAADAPQLAVVGTGGTSELKKKPGVRPIAELWDEAFEKLKGDEKDLVMDYQKVLNHEKTLTSIVGSTSFFTGLEVPTQLQMQTLLKSKIENIKSKEWKLKFKGHELAVKQLVEPVTSIVEWAQDYVGQALEASIYGSLAWSGVCLLLPVSNSFCIYKL